MSGILYMVATPIGNLDDLSMRARDVLSNMRWVAAEDTRRAAKLLAFCHSSAHCFTANAHNEQSVSQKVCDLLRRGEHVAYVSDAGTPAISDPGARLVDAVRAEHFTIVPLPGCSAVTTILSVAGAWAVDHGFTFIGFLPAQAGKRHATLTAYANYRQALVIYEAPHRIEETLDCLCTVFGDHRQIALGRELTKRYETILVGSLAEVRVNYRNNPIKGEFVLVVEGQTQPIFSDSAIINLARKLRDQGMKPSKVAAVVAEWSGVRRQEIYRALLATDDAADA